MRNKSLSKINSQKGFSLLITLLILGVVLVISLSIATLMIAEIKLVGAYDDSIIAYYAADAGIEDSLLKIRNGFSDPPPERAAAPRYQVTYEQATGQVVGTLEQDESVEVASSEDTKPNEIQILWNNIGTDTAGLEWTLIPYTNQYEIPKCGTGLEGGCIDKGFYDSSKGDLGLGYDKSNNFTNSTAGSGNFNGFTNRITINISPIDNQQPNFKLRVKCLAKANSGNFTPGKYQINYRIVPVNGQLATGGPKINSTGTSNDVRRRIEVNTNLGSPGLFGIFDYVLYSEDQLYKPSSE